jgi:acetaldehyde dehydrogenase (acetylating)
VERIDPDLRALQEVRDCMRRAVEAQREAAAWDQGRTDEICRAMASAGARAAADLARLAVEETGIGRAHYKTLKNLFATEGIWASIEREPTVGVITRTAELVEIATPVGVVAGIVPTTNPTSTALGKALIAVKGRNAIVVSPHPRAKRCIAESVEVLRRAIARAGGPPDLVQSLSNPTLESTDALMRHPNLSMILATGGAGLVKAAYSSGKPAYGVGPGNVPVYVDRSADVAEAARWIVASQSFDNATLCCSEQALVLDAPVAERVLSELRARGAHLCSPEETRMLERFANRGGHMNPDIVGLDPARVAELAGFRVSPHTSLLLAHQGGVGKQYPLSIEILCPLLSVHVVDGWKQGCALSIEILENGGLGHTIGVWAGDDSILEQWYLHKPASRIVVNGPTSQGAVGYSTGLVPSMSLGCGPLAGNITSDNVTARHLLNVKRVGLRTADWPQRYERDMRRASEMLGGTDPAPRGSGLPGDPALETGTARAERAAPAPVPTTVRAAGSSRGPAPAPTLRSATMTPFASGSVGRADLPGRGLRPGELQRSASSSDVPRLDPARAALTGSGCPLGPCQGCPHREPKTGNCTA